MDIISSMRVVLIFLCALTYRIDGHGQHSGPGSQPQGGPPHVARKMEDYVHDMEYNNILFLE
jgi:hypothetical protein